MLTPPQPDDDPWNDDTWHMPISSHQAALDALLLDWGHHYDIGIDNTGQWWYRRLDNKGSTETATNPDDLHTHIVQDYTFRPVRLPPSPTGKATQWT